jgi:outer membrane immunogenic protein
VKKHYVGLLVVTLTSVAALATANAADLAVKAPVYKAPVVAPFSWTGFYVGVNGGGAWGNSDWLFTNGNTAGSHKTSGGLVGGTVGANWQFPTTNWVIGAEADWDWADIRGSAFCPNPAVLCQSKIGDLATARGRLGYAFDRVLVYGTGGFAWGSDKVQAVLGSTSNRTGWTAGAGIEYAFWGPWSAKVEYLHYDLGNAMSAIGDPFNLHETGDLVRAGVNWKFVP